MPLFSVRSIYLHIKMKHLNKQHLITVRLNESLSIMGVEVGCTTLNEARTPEHMAEVEIWHGLIHFCSNGGFIVFIHH